MATLVLQVAGSTVGAALGGPVGAMIGRTLGGLAGAAIDATLLSAGGKTAHQQGPRLTDAEGLTSTEGAGVPRLYGRARLGGQLIWATRLEEVATASVSRSSSTGGKAVGGSKTATTTYSYYANLAIGLCEGPIAFVRRVWADGRELDQNGFAMRVHRGTEDQDPDPLIVAKEGAENAPAYRGLAYVVLERFPLADFGNRVPQFAFEVVRPAAGLGEAIRAVNLIPGASEFAYEPAPVTQMPEPGVTRPENRHQLVRSSDVVASLDQLQALCPNLEKVALVVSWFGDDLRAGHCTIAPRIDDADKITFGAEWSVAGLTRLDARAVSLFDGAPAYGGTPSDAAVIHLIEELKGRGLQVVLYPFIMMDVPAGNGLPSPYGGGDQPAYPWRGRVTCFPAPGVPGSPDGTAEAAAEIAALFGSAAPGDFAVNGETVVYSGPDEWTLRRHILHCAHLAVAAGGVHGFVIGSEMVGITRVRSAPGTYPAVAHLVGLANDVRSVLGPATRLVYAADWTEYGAHVRDGGAEVRFPLDPLWASPALDAVGIDFYPPISDWRDGTSHLDQAEARSVYDPAYLEQRVAAGEAFDWFYASSADRDAQVRTPITDGAYGKPWIYRAKDLIGWWSNAHIERVGGVETTSTAWTPRAKPIWLTEIGVPAIDKGTNAPNLFADPKSSESAVPPFSRGLRDDLLQISGIQAILSRFGGGAAANPISPLYGGPMVDPGSIFVWAWDTRPFPAFPQHETIWGDGANWQTGHWLTGRLEGVPLDRLIAALLADFGLPAATGIDLDGFVDGYVVNRPMSARQALEPLAAAFAFDALASGAGIRFTGTGARAVATIAAHEIVPDGEGAGISLRRAQETELPQEVRIGFTDGEREYRRAAAASRRLAVGSRRQSGADLAVVTRMAEAQRLADVWLQDLWGGRETAELSLSPRRVEIEPGDLLALPAGSAPRLFRVTRIADGAERRLTLRGVEPAVYDTPAPALARVRRSPPPVAGRPRVVVLDLPAAIDSPVPLQHLAVFADPWPGTMAIWRSADGASYELHALAEMPAMVGETVTGLPPGSLWRWDRAASLTVRLGTGALTSVDELRAFAGANSLAVQGPDGRWEILSAATAQLVGERTFRLSKLLRGLAGSEAEVGRNLPVGAPVVVLDRAVLPLTRTLEDLGRPWRYRIGPADRDHGDPSVVEIVATAGPDALKPFAPVHLTARRTPAGIVISFIRRTRTGGDAWDAAEVPLGEESERYEIDVRDGATLKRTLTSATPSVLYAAADELADFGAAQAVLSVAVNQVSASVGRGFPASANLPVL